MGIINSPNCELGVSWKLVLGIHGLMFKGFDELRF